MEFVISLDWVKRTIDPILGASGMDFQAPAQAPALFLQGYYIVRALLRHPRAYIVERAQDRRS